MKYSELVITCITYLHFCFITYYHNDSRSVNYSILKKQKSPHKPLMIATILPALLQDIVFGYMM